MLCMCTQLVWVAGLHCKNLSKYGSRSIDNCQIGNIHRIGIPANAIEQPWQSEVPKKEIALM
jgi:hypothetical protein